MSLEADEVDLDLLVEAARRSGYGDIAVAIERLSEIAEESDVNALEEEIDLPFYEEERQDAFGFGLTAGAVLERDYGDEDPLDQTEDTVEQSQSQSITVES